MNRNRQRRRAGHARKSQFGQLGESCHHLAHVKLKPGSNTIRLSNAKGWAPDVDYIDVKKPCPTASPRAPTTQTDAESAAYYGIDGRQPEKSPEKVSTFTTTKSR